MAQYLNSKNNKNSILSFIGYAFLFFVIFICVYIYLIFKRVTKVDYSTRLDITTTVFPLYDWSYHIMGDSDVNEAALFMLVKNAADVHTWQPGEYDISKIAHSDLFVYTGGSADSWAKEAYYKALKSPACSVENPPRLLNLSEVCNADSEVSGENSVIDNHLWLSVKKAQLCVQAICDALVEINPKKADVYKNNLNRYMMQLQALDEEYSAAVENASKNVLIVCDRFPFRSMCEDYGINYYSLLPDCGVLNAEYEPSAETRAYLAEKINENKLKAVYKIDLSNDKLAYSVVRESDNKFCDILTLDSMQSTTLAQALKGASYVKIMQQNLEEMKKGMY